MSRPRLIRAALAGAAALGVAVVATTAAFTDSSDLTTTLTASTVDIVVNGDTSDGTPTPVPIDSTSLSNVAPGKTYSTTFTLRNAGTQPVLIYGSVTHASAAPVPGWTGDDIFSAWWNCTGCGAGAQTTVRYEVQAPAQAQVQPGEVVRVRAVPSTPCPGTSCWLYGGTVGSYGSLGFRLLDDIGAFLATVNPTDWANPAAPNFSGWVDITVPAGTPAVTGKVMYSSSSDSHSVWMADTGAGASIASELDATLATTGTPTTLATGSKLSALTINPAAGYVLAPGQVDTLTLTLTAPAALANSFQGSATNVVLSLHADPQ